MIKKMGNGKMTSCGALDDGEPKVDKDEPDISDIETEPSNTEQEDPMETEVDQLPRDPRARIHKQHKEYSRSKLGNTIPFNYDDAASTRQLDVLRKMKAALNARSEVMKWHLKEKGDIKPHESLKDSQTYIRRKNRLKKLRDRPNCKNKFPCKNKVKLPVSGTVTHQVVHETAAVVQGLLTDPRPKDAELLFHDNKPLVPVPKHPTTIGDLHTGKADRKTYCKTEMSPDSR